MAGSHSSPSAVNGPTAAGQLITEAHGYCDRPFQHPDGTSHSQAGQEADTLVLNVTEDRQINSSAWRLMLVGALVAVVFGLAS